MQALLFDGWDRLLDAVGVVLRYPVTPTQRIYWVYLLTSALAAVAIWAVRREGSLWRFLFPERIWQHPQAWLDLRYFAVHHVEKALWFGLLFGAISSGARVAVRDAGHGLLGPGGLGLPGGWLANLGFTVAVVALVDLAGFAMHVAQHKVPLLWEFHRIHHSAVVMHPITNYREHPVDNLGYALTVGAGFGLAWGLGDLLFATPPRPYVFWGQNALLLLFNLLAYNLRHSHIWLRWPGFLGMVFGSPAHHQIHHSTAHPDRNFAFLLPVWDVLYGSYVLPDRDPGLQFGLGDGTEGSYDSIEALYLLPFKRLVQRWTR